MKRRNPIPMRSRSNTTDFRSQGVLPEAQKAGSVEYPAWRVRIGSETEYWRKMKHDQYHRPKQVAGMGLRWSGHAFHVYFV
mmetsp:Transcript_3633/g.4911  ORF Transcript_3633/g.4911 Transcript_3633/m.4911 type:complete len:81 (+) Transcript_3633:111-353(+)